MDELPVLQRAYRLFAANISEPVIGRVDAAPRFAFSRVAEATSGSLSDGYRSALESGSRALRNTSATDNAMASVLAGAVRDHANARLLTQQVLEAARSDLGAPPNSPVAQREAILRQVARLRAQRGHVMTARQRAARRLAVLRMLRYLALRRARARRLGLPLPNTKAATAVRAALSRLGRPYVWGATGPDSFDCSGLVQWAYRQVGVPLDRTTYDQINDGVAVPRSAVQPGDLVFPHAGHVQMAIGNGMVVEAPHAGANVRISPLGSNVTIRRPVM